jgi:hypothetical protein
MGFVEKVLSEVPMNKQKESMNNLMNSYSSEL